MKTKALKAIGISVLLSLNLSAQTLPSFKLPDLQGQSHQLHEWQGKVILLNFWASWCAPCQYEIKDLIHYQNDYAPQGLQVIGIGLDKTRPLQNVARSLGINYPSMVANPATQPQLLKQWGNPKGVLPYTVIIDADGQIVYQHRGIFNQATFDHKVKPLLNN